MDGGEGDRRQGPIQNAEKKDPVLWHRNTHYPGAPDWPLVIMSPWSLCMAGVELPGDRSTQLPASDTSDTLGLHEGSWSSARPEPLGICWLISLPSCTAH
jgi:hypothetical protein